MYHIMLADNSGTDDDDSDYIPEDEVTKTTTHVISAIAQSDVHENINKNISSTLCEIEKKTRANKLWKQFLDDEVVIVENINSSSKATTICDLPTSSIAQLPCVSSNEIESEINIQTNNASTLIETPVCKKEASVPITSRTNSTKKRGLNSLLGRMQNKKPKMTTLQKSLVDWESFKKDEGISEDLQIFNKGKSGYLERQAFLMRSDLRSFEVENNLRLSKK